MPAVIVGVDVQSRVPSSSAVFNSFHTLTFSLSLFAVRASRDPLCPDALVAKLLSLGFFFSFLSFPLLCLHPSCTPYAALACMRACVSASLNLILHALLPSSVCVCVVAPSHDAPLIILVMRFLLLMLRSSSASSLSLLFFSFRGSVLPILSFIFLLFVKIPTNTLCHRGNLLCNGRERERER